MGTKLTLDGSMRGRLNGHRFSLKPATGPAGLYERTSGTTTETSVVLTNGDIRGAMAEIRPRKCRAVVVSTPSGPTLVTVCG
jgi:hypothetical protein